MGEDLKMSLLDMFNQIKTKGLAPDFMKELLTTTIPKPGLGDSLNSLINVKFSN